MNTSCIDHGKAGNKGGYASCWFEGRYVGEHVRALILRTGEQPKGREACHECDNPRCRNPEHLFWGTRSDNVRDSISKGRHANNLSNFSQTANRRRGVEQRNSRWSDDDIRAMRKDYAAGETQTSIASRMKCRQSDVSRIVRGEYWSHI